MCKVSWQRVKFISHPLLGLKKLAQRFERANHCMCEKQGPGLEDTALADSNLIVKI